MTAQRDGLSWNIGGAGELVADSKVEGSDDVVATPAGRFEGCLRVRTHIGPEGGGTATESTSRSFCGTRTLWFAPGVGLVKLRHEDQNSKAWVVYLVGYEGGGGGSFSR